MTSVQVETFSIFLEWPFYADGRVRLPCTVELSEATAAKPRGVLLQAMQGIGHFPFAERSICWPVLEGCKAET